MRKYTALLLTISMICLLFVPVHATDNTNTFINPNEFIFDDFNDNDLNWKINKQTTTTTMTIADGQLSTVYTGESSSESVDITAAMKQTLGIDVNRFIIEYKLDAIWWWGNVSAGLMNGNNKIMLSELKYGTNRGGIYYVVCDRVTKTATTYSQTYEGVIDTRTFEDSLTASNAYIALQANNGTPAKIDYIAIYEEPEDFNVESADKNGSGLEYAQIKTTSPIDVSLSSVAVDGKAASITKNSNSYNTYTIALPEKYEYNTEYTVTMDFYSQYTKEQLTTEPLPLKTKQYEMGAYNAPKQYFFDDFTQVPDEEIFSLSCSGSAYMTRNTDVGEMIMTVDSYCTPDLCTPKIIDTTSTKIAYEVNVSKKTGESWTVKLRVGNGNESGWTYNYKDIYVCNDACRLYVVLDRISGTAYVYKDGSTEPVSVYEDYFPKGNIETWKGVQIMMRNSINNPEKSINYDYIAAYALPDDFSFEIADAQNTTPGYAIIKTTKPIDMTASIFTANNKPVSVSKVSDTYLTYKLSFDEKLKFNYAYTLDSDCIKGIDGINMISSESIPFKTGLFTPGSFSMAESYFFEDFNNSVDSEYFGYNLGDNYVGDVTWTRNTTAGTLDIESTNPTKHYYQSFWKTFDKPINGGTFVIEYKLNNLGSNGHMNPSVYSNNAWISLGTILQSDSGSEGVFYFVVNTDKSLCTVYKAGAKEPLQKTAITFPEQPITQFKIATGTYKATTTSIDHIAIYSMNDEFSYEIESASQTGIYDLKFRTTQPVDVSSLSGTIEGNTVKITKADDSFNTYTVKFDNHLKYGNDYNICINDIRDLEQYDYSNADFDFSTMTATDFSQYAKISDIVLLSNGEKTYDRFDTGTVSGYVDVECNVNDGVPLTMIVAQYKDGALIGCEVDKNHMIYGDERFTVSYTVNEAIGTTVKIMLFKSLEGMYPIKQCVNASAFSKDNIVVDTRFYPAWNKKAVVFSYDDGYSDDSTLISLFNEHNLKGTFNLIASWIKNPADAVAKYSGQEVSNHSYNHLYANTNSVEDMKNDITLGKTTLSDIFGYDVRGFAWPGDDFGVQELTDWLPTVADYARPNKTNGQFNLPQDWMYWIYTCHHKDLPKYGEQFVNMSDDGELKLMSVWGHTYELRENTSNGTPSTWYLMEDFMDLLDTQDNIWSATCIELHDYVEALKNLEITNTSVKNPSNVSVYILVNGVKVVLQPNQEYIPQ